MTGPKRRSRSLAWLGAILILASVLIFAANSLFPDQTEKYTGRAKVSISHTIAKARGQEHPTVTLGASGGKQLLDACDGTFTRILAYEQGGSLPTYAAHNNCKGDVILPVELGDTIEVKDRGLFEVTDVRVVPKFWSTTDDILGLDGELMLQTCYYGENRMKFLALTPLDPSASGEPNS